MSRRKIDLFSYIREGKEFTFGKQVQLVASLSAPAIMAQLTTVIMEYIDASMVGSLGATSSAAIGLVSSTTWLFGGLSHVLGEGYVIQVSQLIGAKKFVEARSVMKQSFLAALLVALAFAMVAIAIAPFLPIWLGGDVSIRREGSIYFMIYGGFLIVPAINMLAGGLLQASGNMKIPGILNSIMCVLDVIFNMLFIFPSRYVTVLGMKIFLPGLSLGVAGAALGTAAAECVTVLFMLFFLCVKSDLLHIRREEKFQFDFKYLKKAFTICLPIALERTFSCGAHIAFTKIVAPLGVVSIAAHSFGITAESLCYMPGYGIGSASTSLVGQCIGAKRKELARSFARMSVALGMVAMSVTGVLMYVFAPQMIGLLSPDPDVRVLGAHMLRIEAIAEPFYAAAIVVPAALRGAGVTLSPSIINFASMWLIRIPLAYVLAGHYGLAGVWIAMCLELVIRGIMFLIQLLRDRWLSKAKV